MHIIRMIIIWQLTAGMFAPAAADAAQPRITASGAEVVLRQAGQKIPYQREGQDGWLIEASGPGEVYLGLRLVAPKPFRWKTAQLEISARLEGDPEQELTADVPCRRHPRARLRKRFASHEQAVSFSLPPGEHQIEVRLTAPPRAEALLRILRRPPPRVSKLGSITAPKLVVISQATDEKPEAKEPEPAEPEATPPEVAPASEAEPPEATPPPAAPPEPTAPQPEPLEAEPMVEQPSERSLIAMPVDEPPLEPIVDSASLLEAERPAVEASRAAHQIGFDLTADLLIPTGRTGTVRFDESLLPSADKNATFMLLMGLRYRPPLLDGLLGLRVEAGWSQLSNEAARSNSADPDFGDFSSQTRIHSLPIFTGLLVRPSLPLPLIELEGSAGLAAAHAWSQTSYTSAGVTTDNAWQSGWALGFFVEAALALPLGPGEFFGGLRYTNYRTDLGFRDIYDNTYNEELGDLGGTNLLVGYRLSATLGR